MTFEEVSRKELRKQIADLESLLIDQSYQIEVKDKEIAKAEPLRKYALYDARCPCCSEYEACLDGCTFHEDVPDSYARMVLAREAFGAVEAKEEY